MSGSLIPNGKQQYLDANGKPLAGGKVYYYIPSTTTPKNTYQDAALTILNANPIVLDSAGECIAYGSGAYRQIVNDVNGNIIWDQPTYSPITLTDVATVYSAPNGSSLIGYNEGATGAVNITVQSKLQESISVKDFGAKGDGTTNDTTAILSAFASLTSNSSLCFPPGTYIFSNGSTGISINGLSNVEIFAMGAKINFLANDAFINLINCNDVKIHGFLLKGTLSNSQRYVGIENQGQLVPQSCNDVEIYENTWQDTAGGVFLQVNNQNVNVRNNNFIRTHAGCQTSGGTNNSIFICDNYFLGHVYQTVDLGSDDQIAVFGSGKDFVITGNIIDKQGPTAYNQAHGILVAFGPNPISDVIISNNLIKNCVSTTNSSSSITLVGTTGGGIVTNVVIESNNIIYTNLGIEVNVITQSTTIGNNNIAFVSAISGDSTTGGGIRCTDNGVANKTKTIITGNSVKSCANAGIYIAGQSNVIVSNNMVTLSTGQGILLDAVNYAVISNNICTDNTFAGIQTNTCEVISINGNTSSLNSTYGLLCSGTIISGTICGNSFTSNTTANLTVTAGTDNSVKTGNFN